VDDQDFRVEIWTGSDGQAMVRAIQVGDLPPTPYGEGEMQAESAVAAFALARAQVKRPLQQRLTPSILVTGIQRIHGANWPQAHHLPAGSD